jgi:hypothetical protein
VKWVVLVYLGNMGLLTQMASSYFNLLMTLLISIASPESPQDSEGEMGDVDAMMVDDPCE